MFNIFKKKMPGLQNDAGKRERVSRGLWQKIKQNHLLLMTLCCLVPIVVVIGFFFLFKGSAGYWVWLVILLCPLLHILMMRGRKQGLYQCPECGLEYKEKEWAEKCEAWCKKYKSCNLEITKYAINKQD